ncbi:hypothetical protein ASF41_13755 [Methylobacterium sp. Leaf111]|nr:hypothetical protein ASF41_13755 [Methylobacterium sp. Leaf111]
MSRDILRHHADSLNRSTQLSFRHTELFAPRFDFPRLVHVDAALVRQAALRKIIRHKYYLRFTNRILLT